MKKDFNNCKRWLRRRFPSENKVNIRCVGHSTFLKHQRGMEKPYLEELDGICLMFEEKNKDYLLLIDKRLKESEKIVILLHEYAHLLRYHLPDKGNYKDHDGVWQSIFNRLKNEWQQYICT